MDQSGGFSTREETMTEHSGSNRDNRTSNPNASGDAQEQGANRARIIAISTLLLVIMGLVAWAWWPKDEAKKPSVTATPPPSGPVINAGNPPSSSGAVTASPESKATKTHVVKRGEFLITIAQGYGVPWEAIWATNKDTLKANAAKHCKGKRRSYTHRKGRKGHFCNYKVFDEKGQPLVYANTLQIGDKLTIPPATAPEKIQQAVTHVSGNDIVVVIDGTDSMANDRARVSAWYLQAIKNSGKRIKAVVSYSEGNVWTLDVNNPRLETYGGYENTREALEYAKREHNPDAIILVTDEYGNDCAGFAGLKLPPVIAHSLAPDSDDSLKEVARITKGNFLSTHYGALTMAAR